MKINFAVLALAALEATAVKLRHLGLETGSLLTQTDCDLESHTESETESDQWAFGNLHTPYYHSPAYHDPYLNYPYPSTVGGFLGGNGVGAYGVPYSAPGPGAPGCGCNNQYNAKHPCDDYCDKKAGKSPTAADGKTETDQKLDALKLQSKMLEVEKERLELEKKKLLTPAPAAPATDSAKKDGDKDAEKKAQVSSNTSNLSEVDAKVSEDEKPSVLIKAETEVETGVENEVEADTEATGDFDDNPDALF